MRHGICVAENVTAFCFILCKRLNNYCLLDSVDTSHHYYCKRHSICGFWTLQIGGPT